MIATRYKIFILAIVVTVCTIVYVRRNGRKSFVKNQPPIGSVSTAVYYTNNSGTENENTISTENHPISELPWGSYPKNTSSSTQVKLKRRFPNVIIIGAKKSGTSTLREFLNSHPLIIAPVKEMHFFDRYFERGVRWYINQLPETMENEITLEKSPEYFVTSTTPKNLYNLSRNVKLILIVRHPITRAVSDYLHILRRMPWKALNPRPTFESLVFHPNGTIITNISLIDVGMYDIHYQRWLEWFDKKQILVLNGEELIDNPVSILEKVETYLNISHYFKESMFSINKKKGFFCWQKYREDTEHTCFGSTRGRKHPALSNSTWDKLREFFKPHSETFCNLADVNYDWCSL